MKAPYIGGGKLPHLNAITRKCKKSLIYLAIIQSYNKVGKKSKLWLLLAFKTVTAFPQLHDQNWSVTIIKINDQNSGSWQPECIYHSCILQCIYHSCILQITICDLPNQLLTAKVNGGSQIYFTYPIIYLTTSVTSLTTMTGLSDCARLT